MDKCNSFFAMMSRMKYIERWALMRNSRPENISEHCLETAMIAHALVVISNKKFGNNYDASKAALIALYHDASEIITGDMPTPVKYYNDDIKEAFKSVEDIASRRLINMLPDYMKDEYESIFFKCEEDKALWKYVKAADKLSAYIKCIEEDNAGNKEFISAKDSIWKIINEIDMPEVKVFIEDFIPAYGRNLDDLCK
ncbi:MAG: 5'-deoxynucleotidase [Lachnospiraceae bacterium]|nr:5'-deoxynucleotidase [Lachnospiraceae bacterium]